MDKNKVKITIGGANYTVLTDNASDYTESLASEIDAKLGAITASSRFITDTQAAVILTLEYADEKRKLEKQNEELRERLKESLEDAAQAKTQRDSLKRENMKLRKIKKEPDTAKDGE